jgi:hypothetical protein
METYFSMANRWQPAFAILIPVPRLCTEAATRHPQLSGLSCSRRLKLQVWKLLRIYRPFSPTHLGDPDDDAYLLADSSRDIGEIRLQINRVVPLQLQPHQQSMPPQLDQKVHERSKKAVVHRIG